MLDILVASGLLGLIVAVVTRPTDDPWTPTPEPRDTPQLLLLDADLPCPWCGAATHEDDDHCPSCRQRFG